MPKLIVRRAEFNGNVLSFPKTKVRKLAELKVKQEWAGDNSWKIWYFALPKKQQDAVFNHVLAVKNEWKDESGVPEYIY